MPWRLHQPASAANTIHTKQCRTIEMQRAHTSQGSCGLGLSWNALQSGTVFAKPPAMDQKTTTKKLTNNECAS